MLAGSLARAPVRVLIGPGEYALSSTLTFTPLDSGTVDAPVSYEATQPRATTITGAVNLGSKTAPTAVTPVSFAASSYANLTMGGGQFFVNGKRATLARQPNGTATWFVKAPAPLSSEPTGQTGQEAFVMRSANYPWLTSLTAADKQRAIVNVMQAWTSGRHRIASNGAPAGALGISPRAAYAFLNFGNSQRYFIENTKAALDAAGEWIYDNGNIQYIRQTDEAGANITASLPTLDKLVAVQGDAKLVENLKFTGLNFAYTRYLTPDAGFVDSQSAVLIGAAIEVNRASRISIENCNISKTGGWGVWLRDIVRESRVVNNTFTDMGAGGVRIGVTSRLPFDATLTGNNQIIANNISETGKVFPGAAAVWIGNTWDNVVSRNTIFNTTYSGISVGWNWGYEDATSGRNLISANLLFNIGQRLMGDLAAIYTLGKSPGTTITNNVIREVRGYTYGPGAWGIYGDEGTSGVLIENNIVFGTDSGAYHLNFGRDNTVRGNIFAGGDKAEVRLSKSETSTNLVMQNNLILPKTTNPFDMYAQAPSVLYSSNEISDKLVGQAVSYTKCGTGCTLGTSTVSASSSPLALSSTSSSWNAKIQAVLAAYQGSGVPPSGTLGTTVTLPAAVNPPLPILAPAQDYVFDPSAYAVGSQPTGLTYVPANNPDAIKVVANSLAPGGKCLAFNDSSTFTNTWDPHAYAKLEHLNGYSVVEFSLLIDATTNLNHEWRDNDATYKTGPSMNITPRGVEVGGQIVSPITVGKWTKFKLSTPIGAAGGYKWKLEVTAADGTKTVVDNLAQKSVSWGRLNWLGFVSNARVTSSPCLADLKVTNLEP